MLWSYLKTIFWSIFVIIALMVAVGFVFQRFPWLMPVLSVVTAVLLIYWFVRTSWEQHKYYVEHEKPLDDAMKKYWKVCLATEWGNLKKSWAELRSKKTTP
jgi:divalent metal cation (Fe/Co/Zn/Cd) transporter